MNTSESVFRALLAITLTLAIILLALFPFQEPGTGSYVVSILGLSIQGVLILVCVGGLYFGWEPFDFIEVR